MRSGIVESQRMNQGPGPVAQDLGLRSVREAVRDIQTIRRWWRRAGRSLNRLLGKPDAWVDLILLCSRLRPAAVLDVGAHVGRMVERFADECADIPIHAFEPTPLSAATLRR